MMHYPRAEEYLPERWIRGTELSKLTPAFTSLGFGHGRRKCVGKRIAELEIKCLVTKILQKYRLSYAGEPVAQDNLVLNMPSIPVHLIFDKR